MVVLFKDKNDVLNVLIYLIIDFVLFILFFIKREIYQIQINQNINVITLEYSRILFIKFKREIKFGELGFLCKKKSIGRGIIKTVVYFYILTTKTCIGKIVPSFEWPEDVIDKVIIVLRNNNIADFPLTRDRTNNNDPEKME